MAPNIFDAPSSGYSITIHICTYVAQLISKGTMNIKFTKE